MPVIRIDFSGLTNTVYTGAVDGFTITPPPDGTPGLWTSQQIGSTSSNATNVHVQISNLQSELY